MDYVAAAFVIFALYFAWTALIEGTAEAVSKGWHKGRLEAVRERRNP